MKKLEARFYDAILEQDFMKNSLGTQLIHGCNETFYVLPPNFPELKCSDFAGWNKYAYVTPFDDDRVIIGVSADIPHVHRPLMAWHEKKEYQDDMPCTTVFSRELEEIRKWPVDQQRDYLQERTEFWQQLNRFIPSEAFYENLVRCMAEYKRLG